MARAGGSVAKELPTQKKMGVGVLWGVILSL